MSLSRACIVSVDVEGDDCWVKSINIHPKTENALRLPNFHSLCIKHGLKPVYLTNHEMINAETYISFAREVIETKSGEIGMHLHAWNTPPYYELNGRFNGQPYLIEYPNDIMEKKFLYLLAELRTSLGIDITSHRAGRWAMNKTYFDILEKHNITVDCSITPLISGKKMPGITIENGPDYTFESISPHMVGNILEVPMTIRKIKHLGEGGVKHRMRSLLVGHPVWLRPAIQSFSEMKSLINNIEDEDTDYIQFMIHSSELLAGGSPYNKNETDVNKFLKKCELIFKYVQDRGYVGTTLKEYLIHWKQQV